MMRIKYLKRIVKICLRAIKDRLSGDVFASKTNKRDTFRHCLSISQEIKPSETFKNKLE